MYSCEQLNTLNKRLSIIIVIILLRPANEHLELVRRSYVFVHAPVSVSEFLELLCNKFCVYKTSHADKHFIHMQFQEFGH